MDFERTNAHNKYTYSGSGVDVTRNDEFTDYIKQVEITKLGYERANWICNDH